MAKLAQLQPIEDDPYRHAREVYNDRYANLAAGKRNWQMAAFCAFALAGCAAWSRSYRLESQPKCRSW